MSPLERAALRGALRNVAAGHYAVVEGAEPSHWSRCQTCGAPVDAYSTPIASGGLDASKPFVQPPVTARPCGHRQPRLVVWNHQSPTYPPDA